MNRFLVILTAVLWTACLGAQTNAPLRLALIAPESALRPALDLLTVELSRDERIVLLERSEIERVLREQSLSAAGQDYLKVCQVLGADGLLLFEQAPELTNRFFAIRLVAVKPGVVIESARFGWPIENLPEWAAGIRHQLQLQAPKLNVSRDEAIPLSLVNLRSAIQSSEGRELERQLAFLTMERLSREKQLFVLERRRMQVLAEEKEWNLLDDSPFWSGGYLLEGVIDRDGYSAEQLTLNVRMAPPGGAAPIEISVRESRTNLAAVVDALSWKVTEALKLNPSRLRWNPSDESEQFFREAAWAMRWKLFGQAQSASEAAWALGKRTPELANLRLRAYSEACSNREPMQSGNTDCVTIFALPDATKLEPITRALDLFDQGTEFFRTNATDVDWLKLGHRALRTASGILESFYYAAEARAGHGEALAQLRAASRRAAKIMNQGAGTNSLALDRWSDCLEYSWLKWNEGGVWFDRPEEALPLIRETLASGFHPTVLPRLIGWTWEDRKRVPHVQKRFIADICAGTNANLRLEGRFLALLRAPTGEPGGWQQHERDLLAAMWDGRAWLFSNRGNVSLLPRVEELLRAKHGYALPDARIDDRDFDGLCDRLRREYLTTVNTYDSLLFQKMFWPSPSPKPAAEEARQLLPLVEKFAGRATEKPHMSNSIVMSFHSAAGLPFTRAQAPKPQGPTGSQEAGIEGKFIPWRLERAGIEPGRTVQFSRGQMSKGRLWFAARYFGPQGNFGSYQTAFVEVDPARGVMQEILFPESRGVPGGFLASEDYLFASVANKIECYDFREGQWRTLPIAVEGAAEFLELSGRRFVATKESLMELAADLRSAELVASSRRNPAKHELDALWAHRRGLVGGVNGRIGLLVTNRLWVFNPANGGLTGSPDFPIPRARFVLAGFSWDAGWLVSVTGQPMITRRLLGFSEGAPGFESMLQQRGEFQGRRLGAALVKQGPPPKWDWPEEFPFEHALITVEAKAVWALNPRIVSYEAIIPREPEEPVTFSDDRHATLFRLEPENRRPLALRVRFEPNGKITNPFIAPERENAQFAWLGQNQRTWLPTPEGLVLAVPKAAGHWLIPRAILETKLSAQRQLLGEDAVSKAAPPSTTAAEAAATNRDPIKP